MPAPDALPDGLPVRVGADWDKTSSRLVDSATVPFIFLLLPQLVKNAANMMGGNPAALAVLSWVVNFRWRFVMRLHRTTIGTLPNLARHCLVL